MDYCKVNIDGEEFKSEDFVAVVNDEEKGAKLFYNTDALTLGMAIQMLAVTYRKALSELSEEDQKAVKDMLLIGGLDNE